ncbi:phosphotransferase family protein [Streptomyces sp. NPDC096132]|uniref:phosphotransferase family protein n=1 Tax=Streptomyces sp. NPDC096132 TaxID=3366075 RepID=UPI00380775FC
MSRSAMKDTGTPPVDRELFDPDRLSRWMDDRGLPGGRIGDVRPVTGGTQNVLVRFERGGQEYVLRRPPRHKRPNSDETMRREAQLLTALAGTDVPHPRLIAACDTTDVIGAAFYLMEPVEGVTPATELLAPLSQDPALQRELGLSVIDSIAALSRVDPRAVPYYDASRAEGWLTRQVGRWSAQLSSYEKYDGYPGFAPDTVERVTAWLNDHQPRISEIGVIHGDFHLANVIVRPDTGTVAAIVDWELAAIGDPLLDLGHLLATWPVDGNPVSASLSVPGLPSRDDLVEHYATRTGRDLDALTWFRVLACYRLAVVLEGTHARAGAGQAPADMGARLHTMAQALIDQADGLIRRPTSPTSPFSGEAP